MAVAVKVFVTGIDSRRFLKVPDFQLGAALVVEVVHESGFRLVFEDWVRLRSFTAFFVPSKPQGPL